MLPGPQPRPKENSPKQKGRARANEHPSFDDSEPNISNNLSKPPLEGTSEELSCFGDDEEMEVKLDAV